MIYTQAQLDKLPDSDFALVKNVDGKTVRSYPIPDVQHAALAVGRSKDNASAADQATIKAAVCKRYPSLNLCAGYKS